MIKQVRELRSENDLKPSKELSMQAELNFALNENLKAVLYKMCKVNVVASLEGETIVRPLSEGKILFAMSEVVDIEAEIVKIEKELASLEKEIARSTNILGNENFLKKAPEAKIQVEKEKLVKYQTSFDTLQNKLKEYQSRR